MLIQALTDTQNTYRGNCTPFELKIMEQNRNALDRLDLTFRWGDYGFRILRCHLHTFPPGAKVPLHKHSEYEFHFIPRGKGRVVLNEDEYHLYPGHFYLTGPNVLHYQEAAINVPMDELCLHVDIQKIMTSGKNSVWESNVEAQEAETCINALAQLPSTPVIDHCNAMQWFSTAYQAWYENQYGAYAIMKYAMIQILLGSVQNYTHDRGQCKPAPRDSNMYRYQLATQFVQNNYSQPITLEDVAEELHLSPRQLQRIFAQHGGQKFREYVENVRLTHVCRSLLRDRGSIEEISLQNGFSSASYLHYVFKRKYSMTPSQFKEQYRKSSDRRQRELVR